MRTCSIAAVALCAMTLLPGTMAGSSALAQATSDAPPRVDTSGVNLQPAYPETARRLSESGSVAILAFVRDDGTVKRVSLARSSGYDDLDSAAATAVAHWKFLPAMQSGQPASGKAVVQIIFQPPVQ